MRRSVGLLVLLACTSLAGCGLQRVRQLEAEVARLEAENERLTKENGQLQSELQAVRQELEKLKARQEQLGAVGVGKLRELIKQYSEMMKVAKDLGLPELKDMQLDKSLEGLLPEESQPSEKKAAPKSP